ncbi:MAG: alpha-ketoacid dehydrogenase subunit beta [Candidatus Omnitrophota bacterium]
MWDISYPERKEFERACKLAGKSLRGLTYKDATREALYQMMEKDPKVFIMGEGVDHYGWIFGTTKGFVKRFGKRRVFDTPIAENTMTGVAVGAGLCGLKPIVVHMRMDFLMLAMDQIVNHAAKLRYMSGGKVKLSMVIRTIIGRGWGSAAQHSQSLYSYFMHVPGLKVVIPTTPYDVKGLLVSSIESEGPVVFIETKYLAEHFGYVPKKLYKIEFGKGTIKRRGSDITVVAVSYMVHEAIKAADLLKCEGISVEVVDLRSIRPLDEDIIIRSVKKTGRLIVADAGWKTCGLSAEIAAIAGKSAFKYLKKPVERITLPDAPTPASPVLEEAYYPMSKDIINAARRICRRQA